MLDISDHEQTNTSIQHSLLLDEIDAPFLEPVCPQNVRFWQESVTNEQPSTIALGLSSGIVTRAAVKQIKSQATDMQYL